jgi:Gas vesicle synthesis protein GvpL/GvpF
VTDLAGKVYVYGVIAASGDTAPQVEGIEAAPVRLVGRPELGALVSDLGTDALSAPKAVRAHWRVLEEASQDATIVPVRFGMVMESEDAVVARLLEANQETLSALLHDVAGKVQLTVKGKYDEDRMLREIVQSTPAVAELNERLRTVSVEAAYYDRIRLGELVAAEVDHRRVADTVAAVARLEPLAEAVREQEVREPNAAYDLAFRVRRERIDDFSKGVRELDRDVGDLIELSYVGPSPAYSFAEANLDEGSPAWA